MRPVFAASAATLAVIAGSNPARAAVEITMEFASSRDDAAMPKNQTMYLSSDGMKMDFAHNEMLFKSSSGAMLMVDNQKHTYMDLGDMAKQMAAVQAQMEASMKNLPEAQRKQMEGAMGKMAGSGGAPSTPPTYVKAGTGTVGSWSCQVYHVTFQNDIKADECIAAAGDLGITAADVAMFKNFSEQMIKSMPFAGRGENRINFDAQTQAIGFEGFPVETTMYTDGKQISKTTVKAIAHDPIAAATFDVPAGYTKQSMSDMMGHKGGGAPQE